MKKITAVSSSDSELLSSETRGVCSGVAVGVEFKDIGVAEHDARDDCDEESDRMLVSLGRSGEAERA